MRKLALIAASLAFSTPAWAGQQDFVLINQTGEEVAELYVSPTSANDWEEDVLGVDVLDDGSRIRVRFSDDADHCHYDLKLVHSDGANAVWTDFNLCKVSTIRVYYDRDGEPQAEYE